MMLDSDYAPVFVLMDVGLYMLLAELMLKFSVLLSYVSPLGNIVASA